MAMLLKFSYGDEWRRSSQEEIVIQNSSICISSHKHYREFPRMGGNVSHASEQFQCLIRRRTGIKHQSITMEIHHIHKIQRSRKEYKCVCEPRGIENIFH